MHRQSIINDKYFAGPRLVVDDICFHDRFQVYQSGTMSLTQPIILSKRTRIRLSLASSQ